MQHGDIGVKDNREISDLVASCYSPLHALSLKNGGDQEFSLWNSLTIKQFHLPPPLIPIKSS